VCLVRKDFLIGGAGIFTYSTALAAKESSQIWIKGISLAKTGLCYQTFLPCAWEEYFSNIISDPYEHCTILLYSKKLGSYT
jgi:hypothetical protein